MEVPPGFEPGIAALQAAALPLGDGTILKQQWCPEPDLNRHGRNVRGILSPLCLPFHHPGINKTDCLCLKKIILWSGRRDSNPRP